MNSFGVNVEPAAKPSSVAIALCVRSASQADKHSIKTPEVGSTAFDGGFAVPVLDFLRLPSVLG
jgi:hypothetical protein